MATPGDDATDMIRARRFAKRNHDCHRPEDFLLERRIFWRHSGEYRRLEKQITTAAADFESSTSAERILHHASNVVTLSRIDERSQRATSPIAGFRTAIRSHRCTAQVTNGHSAQL